MSERCSVIIVMRDRFSTTQRTFECLEKNTPEAHDLIVVVGGAPPRVEKNYRKLFGRRAELIFRPVFLNANQARNIGLGAAKTRLAAFVDNDVSVRPGWLGALLRCQAETGAAMVVPNMLEDEHKIHTAGNDLFVTHKNGRAYGRKHLRYYRILFFDSSNLKRTPTDYGELHCQLIEVETARRLGVYDENIHEVGEVDAGLTWAKAGCPMWFEPASVIVYEIPRRIIDVDDIRFYEWRWSAKNILPGYLYFQKKWGIDITDQGDFKTFLYSINAALGFLPRLWPSRPALFLDHRLADLGRLFFLPWRAARYVKMRRLGHGEWDKHFQSVVR